MLIAAVLFDLVRGFFQFFWFFGPALAGVYCTVKASGAVGTTIAGAVCGAAATYGGALISEATIPFGVIMADAVGLIAFLSLGLWIVMTNARILKTVSNAPLQFAGAFAVGEIPLLGAFPVFTAILWKMYKTQIRVEKKALEEWKKENADAERQKQNQQAAELMQEQYNQLAAADV